MTTSRIPIVIALGGNAIAQPDEEGNIYQQFTHTRETTELIAGLVEEGYLPVIVHGNGPQVGSVMRRVELSISEVYPIPLHICVADTQAGMGFMICECLDNALRRRGISQRSTAIMTRVEVGRDDPAFREETKPIGRFLSGGRDEEMAEKFGWKIKRFNDGTFRRVVASPTPLRIIEIDLIRRLVAEGEILVVCGGGGIPIVRTDEGQLEGADCVIDKDRTSALLATELGVSTLLIATGVEGVMLNFGRPDAVALSRMTVTEAEQHMADGQFPAGSIGPKVEAAIQFVTASANPDARMIITDLKSMTQALAGKTGTCVVKG